MKALTMVYLGGTKTEACARGQAEKTICLRGQRSRTVGCVNVFFCYFYELLLSRKSLSFMTRNEDTPLEIHENFARCESPRENGD